MAATEALRSSGRRLYPARGRLGDVAAVICRLGSVAIGTAVVICLIPALLLFAAVGHAIQIVTRLYSHLDNDAE